MKRILDHLKNLTGLNLNSAHLKFIENYADKRIKKLNLTVEAYLAKLKTDEDELKLLVDEAAINETYFFREEQQFDFLMENYLPKHKGEAIKFWSAACSSGEEAISLYSMAVSQGFQATVLATDIDSTVIQRFKEGKYISGSFRSDGKKHIHLLEHTGTLGEKKFELGEDHKKNFNIQKFNLTTKEEFPFPKESINIIFIRNVFIYFDKEVRNRIISQMEKILKTEGLLFLSVNEIASVELEKDSRLVKEKFNNVYYFRKRPVSEKTADTKKNANLIQNKVEKKLSESFQSKKIETYKIPLNRSIVETPVPAGNIFKAEQNVLSSSPILKPFNLEELTKGVFKHLNTKTTNTAWQILKSYSFSAANAEYLHYFEGLILNAENKTDEALLSFRKAWLLNASFWPSSFQMGLIYDRKGNTSECRKAFVSCASALSLYIKEKKVCYNSIMEQFSPSYFMDLCTSYINRSDR